MGGKSSCEALVVHCIDYRFQRFLNTHFDKRFLNQYDRVAIAGGVKFLLEGAETGNFELDECSISYKLHHPKTFVLVQHEDCGAYGGSKAFLGFAEEQAFHQEQLALAELMLKKHFANVIIEKYIITLSGKFILV